MPTAQSDKIAISKKGVSVTEKEKELTAQLDTAKATIEANESEVEGKIVEARAKEAKRIQDVSAIIPAAHKDSEAVQAKLFDPATTVESMKAFLFDVNAEIAAKAKEVEDEAAASVAKDMLSIDNASSVEDEDDKDEPTAELNGVDGYFGGKK